VKLKLMHTDDAQRIQSLQAQERQLQDEMNELVSDAVAGRIPVAVSSP